MCMYIGTFISTKADCHGVSIQVISRKANINRYTGYGSSISHNMWVPTSFGLIYGYLLNTEKLLGIKRYFPDSFTVSISF